MNCHATRAVLDLHAEGRLTSGRAKAVSAHLEGCAACRALAVPAPAAAPGKAATSAFKAKLAAVVKAERPAPAEPARALSLFPRDAAAVAFATAAVAVIALGLGWNGVPNQNYDGGDELAGRIR